MCIKLYVLCVLIIINKKLILINVVVVGRIEIFNCFYINRYSKLLLYEKKIKEYVVMKCRKKDYKGVVGRLR